MPYRIPECIGLLESVFRAVVNRSRPGLMTISWPLHLHAQKFTIEEFTRLRRGFPAVFLVRRCCCGMAEWRVSMAGLTPSSLVLSLPWRFELFNIACPVTLSLILFNRGQQRPGFSVSAGFRMQTNHYRWRRENPSFVFPRVLIDVRKVKHSPLD